MRGQNEGSTTIARSWIGSDGRMCAGQHFSISAFWFAINLLWGAVLIILVPSQMRLLAPEHPAETAGMMLGATAVVALVVPLVTGYLSDRCMSKLGRRRPYMIAGIALNLVGLGVQWFGGHSLTLWVYVVGYVLVQIGNNTALGAFNGVIPDLVPVDQRGTASGWMAAMSQFGTIVGLVSAGVLVSAGLTGVAYLLIAFALIVFLVVTCFGIRETPRTEPPERGDIADFVKSLWIDPRKHPNFAWVWITRFLVVMGLWTVQEFMQYYLMDVAGVGKNVVESTTAIVLGASLVCATVTGIFGGMISDRVGRKIVVYVANTIIAVTCILFLFSNSVLYSTIVGAIFGLGYGAYYSVDWALGCDVLPNKEDAGKDMAVWHISMVLPQSIVLPISGGLLGAFGRTTIDSVTHYNITGYTVIFSMAAAFLLLGAIFLRNVRGIK